MHFIENKTRVTKEKLLKHRENETERFNNKCEEIEYIDSR